METAPRNCRFLSLAVVERALRIWYFPPKRHRKALKSVTVSGGAIQTLAWVPSWARPGPIPGPKGSRPDWPCALFYSGSDPSRSRGGGHPGPSWSHPAPERSFQGGAWTGRNRLLGHFRENTLFRKSFPEGCFAVIVKGVSDPSVTAPSLRKEDFFPGIMCTKNLTLAKTITLELFYVSKSCFGSGSNSHSELLLRGYLGWQANINDQKEAKINIKRGGGTGHDIPRHTCLLLRLLESCIEWFARDSIPRLIAAVSNRPI